MNRTDALREIQLEKELAKKIYADLRNSELPDNERLPKMATVKGIFDYFERIRADIESVGDIRDFSIPRSDVTLVRIIGDMGGYSLQGNNPEEVERLFKIAFEFVKAFQQS